jgi:hypothetical protein
LLAVRLPVSLPLPLLLLLLLLVLVLMLFARFLFAVNAAGFGSALFCSVSATISPGLRGLLSAPNLPCPWLASCREGGQLKGGESGRRASKEQAEEEEKRNEWEKKDAPSEWRLPGFACFP